MTIRKATEKDVEYVAKTVLTALDMDISDLEWVKASCADPKSMYSWNKALIAEQDSLPIGGSMCIHGWEDNRRHDRK